MSFVIHSESSLLRLVDSVESTSTAILVCSQGLCFPDVVNWLSQALDLVHHDSYTGQLLLEVDVYDMHPRCWLWLARSAVTVAYCQNQICEQTWLRAQQMMNYLVSNRQLWVI